MILGGHVSIAGGLMKGWERSQALGWQAIQIHPSPPQRWQPPHFSAPDETAFAKAIHDDATLLFLHNIYLTNFASPNPGIWSNSIAVSQEYLRLGNRLGAVGVPTHLGSHKGAGLEAVLNRLLAGLSEVLNSFPQDNNHSCRFLIENTAGAGGSLGRSLEEIALIADGLVEHKLHLGYCLDSCHAFAAGLPIHTAQGLEDTLAEFDSRLGLENLLCLHLNDSKYPFGSQKDRHANIGDGFIGAEAFQRLFHHPKLQHCPFIMEVPGLDGNGPDATNRDRVLALAT